MELNHTAMKALLDAFDRSDWQEMTVTIGDDRLYVSRQASTNGAAQLEASASAPAAPALAPAAPAPPADAEPAAPATAPASAAPAAPAATAVAPADGTVVESPSVGLFWRAPAPTEPPFVEVGARVETGDTLAIVEVMKLMNHVTSPVAGVVTAVLVDNGATVEYGQALVTIDPEG